jgi:DNA-binding PadR family transcriptional regulator
MESETLTQTFRKEIVQRVTRNFLDILILRLLQTEPMWGYKIIKKIERLFGTKIRHGALYPLLNSLEARGFVRSQKIAKKRRVRRVYEITSKGIQLIDVYYDFLKEQLQGLDIKEA